MVFKHVPQGAKVLVVGAEHLQDEVGKAGLTPVQYASDHPTAVIQGWFPQMTWQMLAEASFAVENGAMYFVTNRDLTIPREAGIAAGLRLNDSGSHQCHRRATHRLGGQTGIGHV